MRRLAALLMALGLFTAACGDDDLGATTRPDPGTSATTTPTTAGGGDTTLPDFGGGSGGCAVDVTGDVNMSWEGPDDLSSFTSDYWYTEDELRQQFTMFTDPERGTFEEEMAAGNQIFTFFLFNCSGPNGELASLGIFGDATRADFPFGPGTYVIRGGMFFDSEEMGPADFTALFAINDTDVWGLDGTGTVTLSEWDGDHLVGSFSFDVAEQFAAGTPRTASVSGNFEVTCQASVQC